MTLSHHAFMIALINIAIIAMIAFIGWVTMNPLVIAGLYMLQQVPIIVNDASSVSAVGDELDANEPIPSATESRIGFTATLRK